VSAKVHPRTAPGLPADWDERAIVGGQRRRRIGRCTWFLLGLLLGLLLATLTR
jgi:hypothetical protein